MPSASSKPDQKTSSEAKEPFKQVLNVVEKKVRNLEKRKGKLDGYRAKKNGGETLNEDQQAAIDQYDVVDRTLAFATELQKQFLAINAEAEKWLRKQAKRDKVQQQTEEVARIREVLKLQATLDNMGSDDARHDFLNGSSGAVELTEENLDSLDSLYKLISPSPDAENSYAQEMTTASEHIVSLLDAKDKAVIGEKTYKDLKEVIISIQECGYFEKKMQATGTKEKVVKEEEEDEEDDDDDEEPEEEETPPEEESTPDTEGGGEVDTPAAITQQHAFTQEVESSSAVATGTPTTVDTTTLEQHQHSHTMVTETLQSAEITSSTFVAPEIEHAMPESVHLNEHKVSSLVPDHHGYDDDASFFTTAPFPRQRPFQELVSSVQGTFNFLQASELSATGIVMDTAPPHIDPAVVAAQPMPSGRPQQSEGVMSGSYQSSLEEQMSQMSVQQQMSQQQQQQQQQQAPSQQQQQQPQSLVDKQTQNTNQHHHHQQQQQQQHQQHSVDHHHTQSAAVLQHQQQHASLDSYTGHTASQSDYTQSFMNQQAAAAAAGGVSFGMVEQQQQQQIPPTGPSPSATAAIAPQIQQVVAGVGHQSAVSGLESSALRCGVTEVPPAIPMPNETSIKQSSVDIPNPAQLTAQQQSQQANQEKKPFTMNPNAAMFQSMYGQGTSIPMTMSPNQQPINTPPTTVTPGNMAVPAMDLPANVSEDMSKDPSPQQKQQHVTPDPQSPPQQQQSEQQQSDQQQQQMPGNEYQGGFGSGYSGRPSSGGPPGRGGVNNRGGAGGRGGRGGMSNGYNPRGTRGGSNQYGGGPNRGAGYMGRGGGGATARGGYNGFPGYPPRSDYRPDSYQGLSNGNMPGGPTGFPSGPGGPNKRGSAPRGAGAPRGGMNMRGGRQGYGAPRGSMGAQQPMHQACM